jgi:WD40 repeat protein
MRAGSKARIARLVRTAQVRRLLLGVVLSVIVVAGLSIHAQDITILEANGLPATLDAHLAEVSETAFTPDSRILATASYDGTLKLWDTRSGEALRTLSGHQSLVLSLAVSPDGNTLASGSNDNTIKLWDVPTDGPTSSWPGHESAINDIAVRPDGLFAVSAGDDKAVRVWDRTSGKLLQSLEGHVAKILRTAFRGDGNQWATGDNSGVVTLWTPGKYLDEDPTVGRALFAHPDAISGISFAPNNQTVLTSGRDGTIKQWTLNVPPHRILAAAAVEADTPAAAAAAEEVEAEAAARLALGQIVAVASNSASFVSGGPDGVVRVFNAANGVARALLDQPGPVRSLTISPNATLVATGSETGAVKLWNLANGTDRLQLHGHDGPVRSVSFHPDNARLASTGEDGTIRFWKLPTPPQLLAGHTAPVETLALAPNGQFVVTAGRDNSVRLWNGTSGAAVATGAGHSNAVGAAAFRADSAQFATGDAAGVVRFWNGTNATATGFLGAHTAPVTGIAWHPAGERLVTTAADGTARLWRFPLTPPRTLAGHTELVNAVALSSDGKLAATASADQTVRLYDLAAGSQLRQLVTQSGVMTALDFSPDNATVAAASATGSIIFRKTADAADQLAVAGHDGPINAINFRADGQRIASAGQDGTIRVWSLPQPALPLAGHTLPVQAAAATADGKLIATASADKLIRLWSPAGGASTATLTGHEQPIHAIAFRPDGTEAASGDAVGFVRFWDVTKAAAGMVAGAHDGPIRTVAYHPTEPQLLTGSDDGTIKLWKLPLAPPTPLAGHTDAVQAVTVSRDGKLIVTGGADGQVRVVQPGTDEVPVVLAVQPGPVTSLSFSGDDKVIASGSATGFVKAWNVADSTPAFQFQGHTGSVTGIAVQPLVKDAGAADAAKTEPPLLATTGEDGTLRIWNSPTDPVPLESFTQQITRVVTSRDGKLLATSGLLSGRPAIVIRNLETDSRVTTLLGHAGPVRAMQFSADGKKLATGSDDGTARVWDMADAKFPELARFTGHAAAVTAVTISIDGTQCVSGAANNSLKVWNIADGAETQNLAGHTAPIVALTMLPDGTAVSAGDTSVRFWNPANAQPIRTFAAPAVVTAMTLSPDGVQLIVGSANNSLTAHNPANGQPLFELPGHLAPVRSIAFSGDGARIASRSADGEYRVWESTGRLREARIVESGATALSAGQVPAATRVHGVAFDFVPESLLLSDPGKLTGRLVLSLRHLIAPAATPLNGVAFQPDGKGIVTAGADKIVRLWNLVDGAEVRQFPGHTDVVTSVAITHDGAQVLAGSVDKTVRIWNTADATAVATLTQTAAVRSLALSADSTRLVVTGDDALVRVWDMATGHSLQRFAGHVGAVSTVSFGADATTFVTGGADKAANVWSIAAQRVLVAGEGAVKQAAFVGDGSRFAAVVGDAAIVRVWNQADDVVTDLAAGAMPLSSLAVHLDGSILAAGSADKNVYQWTLADGKPAEPIETPAAITQLAFAQSTTLPLAGKPRYELLVGGADNRVRVFAFGSNRRLEEFPTAVPVNVLTPIANSRKVVTVAAANAAAVHERSLLQLVDAHVDGVNDLVHSPDGKQLISGGADGLIRIWNTESAAQVRTLTATTPVPAAAAADAAEPAKPTVTSVAITTDGKRLVSSTNQKKVQIWDLAAAGAAATQPVAVFEHAAAVKSARPSADGSRLATLAADNVIRVYDVATGRELERFESGLPAEQPLLDLAFTPDQETVLAAGTDKLVHVWRVSALRLLEAHEGPSTAVAFVGDGARFATTGGDATVRLWSLDAKDKQPTLELKGGEGALSSLAVDAAGTMLTAAGADEKLYTWKLADGSLVSTVETPAAITGLSLAGEPLKLAVAGLDRSVRVYSPEDGRLLEEVRVPLPEPPAAAATAVTAAATEDEPVAPTLRVALAVDGSRIFVNSANEGRIYPLSLLRLVTGHAGAVAGGAFTPDGTKLVTGGTDKTLRLWQVTDGAPLRAWAGHDAAVSSVAIMADGKTIVTGSLDQTVRLWPVELPTPAETAAATAQAVAGEVIKVDPLAVYAHPAAVRSVQPSANGTRMAAASDDGFVRVWDVGTGRELERFGGHAGPVSGVAFLPDNLRVISGGSDASVREWRISATRVIAAHEAPITGLSWLANGAQFASAGEDGSVRLWDTNLNLVRTFGLPDAPAAAAGTVTPEPVATPAAQAEPKGPFAAGVLTSLTVRRDLQQLTAAVTVGEGEAASGKLLVWNIANAELLQTVPIPTPVRRLEYSADNLKLVVSGFDKTVRVYSAVDGELQQEVTTAENVRVAVFAPDSRHLLIGGDEQAVHTWRYVSPAAVRTLTGHGGGVYSVKFTPDGARIASCSVDGTIRLWNAVTGQQLLSLPGHTGAVTSLDISPDGALIVSSGIDSTVRLWDATGGRQLKTLAATEGAVYSVSFSADGKLVAAGGADKRVYVFNAETGAVQATIEQHEDHIYKVRFSPRSNRLISLGYSGKLFVWNPTGGVPLFETDVCRVAQSACYSPDAATVSVASGDGQVHFLSLPEAIR